MPCACTTSRPCCATPCGITHTFGTAAPKQRWLVPLAHGEPLGCFCLTDEPHVGSDASAIRTTATREGKPRLRQGVKQFITNGKHADMAAGKKGIACLLVPTSTPGYIVARLEEKRASAPATSSAW